MTSVPAGYGQTPPERPDDDDDWWEGEGKKPQFRVWHDGTEWCALAHYAGSPVTAYGHGTDPGLAMERAENSLYE